MSSVVIIIFIHIAYVYFRCPVDEEALLNKALKHGYSSRKGAMCNGHSPSVLAERRGRPRTSEENIHHVEQAFSLLLQN